MSYRANVISDVPRHEVKRKPPEHSAVARESIRRMWVDEKKSYTEIADILNTSRATISGLVRRMKLPKRNPTPFAKERPKPLPKPAAERLVRLVSSPQAATETERTAYDATALLIDGKPITVLNV
jgi:hypothetical protein